MYGLILTFLSIVDVNEPLYLHYEYIIRIHRMDELDLIQSFDTAPDVINVGLSNGHS
jgi:hypothetical protein